MHVIVESVKTIEKSIFVPKSAVVLRGTEHVVFTSKNYRSIWNYVKLGEQNDKYWVINEGLSQNDTIITSGNLNLAHDVKLIVE